MLWKTAILQHVLNHYRQTNASHLSSYSRKLHKHSRKLLSWASNVKYSYEKNWLFTMLNIRAAQILQVYSTNREFLRNNTYGQKGWEQLKCFVDKLKSFLSEMHTNWTIRQLLWWKHEVVVITLLSGFASLTLTWDLCMKQSAAYMASWSWPKICVWHRYSISPHIKKSGCFLLCQPAETHERSVISFG